MPNLSPSDLAAIGQQVLNQLTNVPVPAEQAEHLRFPRCQFCGRRPELVRTRGSWLRFNTGLTDPPVIEIPRYEIAPCCSARYTKVVEHVTRKEKLRDRR